MVSHDRHFLNRVCTHVCDVDFRTIRTFVGNWDVYAAAEQLARAQRSKARVEKQLEKLKGFVERFKSAARSRQATSRQKQIDQMSGQRVVPSSASPRLFSNSNAHRARHRQSRRHYLRLRSQRNPLQQFFPARRPWRRIAVVGRNGIGKTTLLRLLLGDLA